jgi:hypothetical protein
MINRVKPGLVPLASIDLGHDDPSAFAAVPRWTLEVSSPTVMPASPRSVSLPRPLLVTVPPGPPVGRLERVGAIDELDLLGHRPPVAQDAHVHRVAGRCAEMSDRSPVSLIALPSTP